MTMEGARARRLADRYRLVTKVPAGREPTANHKENPMFWMIAAILVFPWLLGLMITCTIEGVHSPHAGACRCQGAGQDHSGMTPDVRSR
jgi:hypothetical protein